MITKNISALDINFNSIKVRLTHMTTIEQELIKTFQFHKGTINPCAKWATYYAYANFNSIKVRLTHPVPR